jgi:hypothetical protein
VAAHRASSLQAAVFYLLGHPMPYTSKQVHLSWHGDESEMWVKWVTLDIYPHLDEYNENKEPRYTPVPYPVGANGSIVEFGETGYTRNSSGIPIQVDSSSGGQYQSLTVLIISYL